MQPPVARLLRVTDNLQLVLEAVDVQDLVAGAVADCQCPLPIPPDTLLLNAGAAVKRFTPFGSCSRVALVSREVVVGAAVDGEQLSYGSGSFK